MMDKFVEYSLRFNRKNSLDNNCKAPIEIRMYLNRIAKYKGTGLSIVPESWNKQKNIPKDNLTNRNCETLIQELKKFESDYRIKNGRFTLTDFQYYYTPEPIQLPKNVSFTKFYAEQLESEKP